MKATATLVNYNSVCVKAIVGLVIGLMGLTLKFLNVVAENFGKAASKVLGQSTKARPYWLKLLCQIQQRIFMVARQMMTFSRSCNRVVGRPFGDVTAGSNMSAKWFVHTLTEDVGDVILDVASIRTLLIQIVGWFIPGGSEFEAAIKEVFEVLGFASILRGIPRLISSCKIA